MNKVVILTLVLFLSQLKLFGQGKITKDSTLISAEVLEDTYVGDLKSYCSEGYEKKIKAGKVVQVINMKRCKLYSIEKLFYEIAIDSSTYWIECNKLSIDTTYVSDLENCTSERIEKIRSFGIYYSWLSYKKKLLEVFSFYEQSAHKGVAIYDWDIYDESEYTDGTGFKITFLNPTNLTIKYIWITVSGYNAVNDKVIDPFTGQTSKTVQCIGPIETDKLGSYNFEYFWHSDIVQTAEITQVKIQYMNGTTKIVANPMSLVISEEYKELLD